MRNESRFFFSLPLKYRDSTEEKTLTKKVCKIKIIVERFRCCCWEQLAETLASFLAMIFGYSIAYSSVSWGMLYRDQLM